VTSATGTDSHPEVAELSALSEGLLPPGRGADVREHLAGCELCTDVLASLAEIRGLLGTLPGPQRMPEDIAGRIDAALAAEALLDTVRPDEPGPGVPRGTPARVPRGTSATPAGRPVAPGGPGRGPDGSRRAGRRPAGHGSRRRSRLLAAASATAVLALGGIVYGVVSASGGGSAGPSGARVAQAAGPAVTGQVADQVRRLLAAPVNGQVVSPRLDHTAPHTLAAPALGAPVPPCVLKATRRGQSPLATEREYFQGRDAYLLVLPHPGNTGEVDAFVVGASCSPAGPGTVLFRATYPR
jgi:hypothetical protein